MICSLFSRFGFNSHFILPLFVPTVDQLLKCPICNKTLTNPRTLPCLHSFCLDCLEHQQATASSPFQLRCHQCQAPFTPSATGGVDSFGCIAFIASLKDALVGTTAVKRISRCQKHLEMEIDTYCKTCNESLCTKCLNERHSGHTFCPLSQVTNPLQDQIAGFTINMTGREKEARKATTFMDDIITEIEEQRTAAEKEIATFSSTLHAAVDARVATLICDMHEKGDQLRETAARVKREVDSATVEFREFRIFTEGLLSEGTPHEIAGSHKMVRMVGWFLRFLHSLSLYSG
jgi:tripartite motif-containing protein 2/3